MNLPLFITVAWISGLSMPLVTRREVRASVRTPLATLAFAALVTFHIIVVIPMAVYFYIAFGDWFLLYLGRADAIPSALALVACVCVLGVACAAFLLASHWVQLRRENHVVWLLGASAALAIAAMVLLLPRFAWVGTFDDFWGHSGLVPLHRSVAGLASLLLLLWLVGAWLWTLQRLRQVA